jgi:hypothetical protein
MYRRPGSLNNIARLRQFAPQPIRPRGRPRPRDMTAVGWCATAIPVFLALGYARQVVDAVQTLCIIFQNLLLVLQVLVIGGAMAVAYVGPRRWAAACANYSGIFRGWNTENSAYGQVQTTIEASWSRSPRLKAQEPLQRELPMAGVLSFISMGFRALHTQSPPLAVRK